MKRLPKQSGRIRIRLSKEAGKGARTRVRLRQPESEEETDRIEVLDGIGYGKPPRRHSWKKGQSGNPKGRQKGSRNKRTIITRLMEERLGRRISDPSRLSRYEAMLLKAIQKALAGDTRAMSFIFRRYDDAAEAQAGAADLATEQDEVVYAAFVEKLKREVREDD